MPELVTIDELRAAAGRLAGVAFRTQLIPFPRAGPALLLKPESLQPTGSFKLRGKRIFLMAPLHHHFEQLGWHESKVIARFWIGALVFALFALTTLKLR